MTEPLVCRQCGFPISALKGHRDPANAYCCYGCYLASSITGSHGEEGHSTVFLARLGFSAFLAINAMTFQWALYGDHLVVLFPVDDATKIWLQYLILALSLPVFLLIGLPFLLNAWREIHDLRPGVDTLIAAGTTSAFVYSVATTLRGGTDIYYDTATMVLVIVTYGRYLEASARVKGASALKNILADRRLRARLVDDEGEKILNADEIRVGDRLRVLAGETIAVDGMVLEGTTSADESILTGEHLPRAKAEGDTVLAGSLTCDGSILILCTETAAMSLRARIQGHARSVLAERTPNQEIADRIARVFTPAVLFLSLCTAIWWAWAENLSAGLMHALAVLLIACPCSLGIGASLAASTGFARALRNGILLKSLAVIERVGSISHLFLDKTGTLTTGKLRLVSIRMNPGASISEKQAIAMAVAVESRSEHPFAKAIIDAGREMGVEKTSLSGWTLIPGHGVRGCVTMMDGSQHVVMLSNKPEEFNSNQDSIEGANCFVSWSYLWVDEVICCSFGFADSARAEAQEAIQELHKLEVVSTVISGDDARPVMALVETLRLQDGRSGLLPSQKIDLVRQMRSQGQVVGMVGDGINDGPALAKADIGFALRSGTDLSRQVADITILDDNLTKIPWIIEFGRRVDRTIRWNFIWAFLYNVVGIILAATGWLHPVFAALAMVASSLFVIANSSRLSGSPRKQALTVP